MSLSIIALFLALFGFHSGFHPADSGGQVPSGGAIVQPADSGGQAPSAPQPADSGGQVPSAK